MGSDKIAKLFQKLFKNLGVFLHKGPPDAKGEIDLIAYENAVMSLLRHIFTITIHFLLNLDVIFCLLRHIFTITIHFLLTLDVIF